MPKKRFTEEQIIAALRQPDAGMKVVDICRKMGVSEQSFYRWKTKYAALGVSEPREMRQLHEENRKLKQVVADLTLDADPAGGDVAKVVKPAAKRAMAAWAEKAYSAKRGILDASVVSAVAGVSLLAWLGRRTAMD